MALFTLIGGSYTDENKRKWKTGEVVSSSKPLDMMFPNSFQACVAPAPVVAPVAPPVVAPAPAPILAPVAPPAPAPGVLVENNPLGQDVTPDFTNATQAGFHVFEGPQGCFVTDPATSDLNPLNSEPLPRDEVAQFVAEYIS